MKRFKIFIIILIAVCTILGLIYLGSIARDMERYTWSSQKNEYSFVLISGSNEGFEKMQKKELLEYAEGLIMGAGYECSIVDTEGKNKESSDKAIKSVINGKDKVILLDISPTKLVVSGKSIILRVSRMDETRYKQNLEYAKKIKEEVKDKNLTVRIITDEKQQYYQNLGEECLRLELWNRADKEAAKEIISKVLSGVIE